MVGAAVRKAATVDEYHDGQAGVFVNVQAGRKANVQREAFCGRLLDRSKRQGQTSLDQALFSFTEIGRVDHRRPR